MWLKKAGSTPPPSSVKTGITDKTMFLVLVPPYFNFLFYVKELTSSKPKKQGIKVATRNIEFKPTLRIRSEYFWHFFCLKWLWKTSPGENLSSASNCRKDSLFSLYRWPPAAASIITGSSWTASSSKMCTGCSSCCWSLKQTTGWVLKLASVIQASEL